MKWLITTKDGTHHETTSNISKTVEILDGRPVFRIEDTNEEVEIEGQIIMFTPFVSHWCKCESPEWNGNFVLSACVNCKGKM